MRVGNTARATGLAGLVVVLAVVVLAGVAIGAKGISPHTVLDALFGASSTPDEIVVRSLRVPRTLIGICVGVALGLAGALMQALTRNPLADPGLLGVNSGASAAIVAGIGALGLSSPAQYVWLSFAGAAAVSVAVYVLGARGGATPVRLALAGTAVAAACTAFIQGALLRSPATFDQFRFWQLGSLSGRDISVFWQLLPFFAIGTVLALGLARPLNAIALGEDAGQALGVRLGRTRVLSAVAITLLCGAATAAAGPIWFVGLAVPQVARAIVGPDQRWVLPYSMLLAPILLLGADIVGRLVVRPGELQVGVVTAVLGAPVLIAVARRRRVAQL